MGTITVFEVESLSKIILLYLVSTFIQFKIDFSELIIMLIGDFLRFILLIFLIALRLFALQPRPYKVSVGYAIIPSLSKTLIHSFYCIRGFPISYFSFHNLMFKQLWLCFPSFMKPKVLFWEFFNIILQNTRISLSN